MITTPRAGSEKKRTKPSKDSLIAHFEKATGFDAVGIDSVMHFLRTRDYSVVQTKDDRYDLDGCKVMSAQELFKCADEVRAQLGRPIWVGLVNMPSVESTK